MGRLFWWLLDAAGVGRLRWWREERSLSSGLLVQPGRQRRPMFVEVPEGKKLDATISRVRFRAQIERIPILITREYKTSTGETRSKPILEVSPDGDLAEMRVPALRVPLGEFVVQQMLTRDRSVDGPAGNLLTAYARLSPSRHRDAKGWLEEAA